jgi:uncharacterized protein
LSDCCSNGSTVRPVIEARLPLLVDGLRLEGGAFIPTHPRAAVVLLHGIPTINSPDPGDTGYPGLARRIADLGWATAWADLRAVRASPGFFSIEGWVRDGRAVVDAVRAIDGVSGLPLAVIGSSAGGAIATELALRGAPLDSLVLLATPAAWTSFADDPAAGVRRITDEAGMAVAPEVVGDARSWAAEFERVVAERSIANVECPVLVVHGTADDVVPVNHAHRIAASNPRAELRIVKGAGHQLRRDNDVMEMVLEWLERSLG